jgi:hypothetical protein
MAYWCCPALLSSAGRYDWRHVVQEDPRQGQQVAGISQGTHDAMIAAWFFVIE